MHWIWVSEVLIFMFNCNRPNSVLKNEYSVRFFSCEVMSFPRLYFVCRSLNTNVNASCHNSEMHVCVLKKCGLCQVQYGICSLYFPDPTPCYSSSCPDMGYK